MAAERRSSSYFSFVHPLFFWIGLFMVGAYCIFSVDWRLIREPGQDASMSNIFNRIRHAVGLTYIKKGIDLAGGTYLVLNVDVDKTVDNRLQTESRSLDALFKEKKIDVTAKTKELKNNVLTLTFEDDEQAKIYANAVKDCRADQVRVDRSTSTVHVTLTSEVVHSIKSGSVDQAISVLKNRLNNFGVEEIVVQRHGERQIVVQLPGVDDPERVKSLVMQTARLEFKIVEQMSASKAELLDKYDGELPSNKMILPGKKNDRETMGTFFLVSSFSDVTGDRLVDARVQFDEFNKPIVAFRLDPAGAMEFAELTGKNIGRSLGIIIDDVMFMAPRINSAIPGGQGTITGLTSGKEAADLAVVLRSGQLQAPLKFESQNRVGASLGQDSIYRGLLASLVAFLVLFLFAILWYKVPGIFAALALLYNFFLILLFLSPFRATLTLPGIAGMVVSIGMAIDASILIYEHIKEELAAGSQFRSAVTKGFSGALVVILDSNITTFITGLILFQFGGPAVRGFAVTLMAGIIATILAGVYFLRSLFYFFIDVVGVKSLKF